MAPQGNPCDLTEAVQTGLFFPGMWSSPCD